MDEATRHADADDAGQPPPDGRVRASGPGADADPFVGPADSLADSLARLTAAVERQGALLQQIRDDRAAAARPLLSVREAAALLGLGRGATLRLAREHGALVNLGGERGLRVLRDDLLEGLRAKAMGGRPSRCAAGRRKAAPPRDNGQGDDALVVWDESL